MAIYNTPTRLYRFNATPPSEGLIAAWNLENVNDSFGANNLTNNNVATFVAAKVLNGVNLDGVNQYLSIADNANISFGAGKKLSITGWFKLDALPAAQSPIISKWSAAGNREYIVRVLNTGELQFTVSNDGTASTSVGSGGGKILASVFYFFTAWYDGNNLYLEINSDGNIFKAAYTADIFNGNSELNIGRNQEAAVFFDGVIDAVRLYKHDNRVLVAPERSSLYNGGLGRQYVTNNVITSDEVNRELNQFIDLFSGIPTEITPKIVSAAQNAIAIINQLGSAEIAQFYKNGSKVLEILNNGQIKSYLATGTAPILITNAATTKVTNLNVEYLDGVLPSGFLKISSKIKYANSVIWPGQLVTTVDKTIKASSDNLIALYAKAGVAASSDSVVKISLYIRGVGGGDVLLLTITVPNNNTLNLFTGFNGSLGGVGSLLRLSVNTLTGTSKPHYLTVGLITQEPYVAD